MSILSPLSSNDCGGGGGGGGVSSNELALSGGGGGPGDDDRNDGVLNKIFGRDVGVVVISSFTVLGGSNVFPSAHRLFSFVFVR